MKRLDICIVCVAICGVAVPLIAEPSCWSDDSRVCCGGSIRTWCDPTYCIDVKISGSGGPFTVQYFKEAADTSGVQIETGFTAGSCMYMDQMCNGAGGCVPGVTYTLYCNDFNMSVCDVH